MTTEGPFAASRRKAVRTSPGGQRRAVRLAAVVGIAGPVLFTAGWLVAGALTPGYSHIAQTISQLAAIGAPYAFVQQAAFVALAIAVFAVAYVIRHTIGAERGWRYTPALLVACAVAVLLTGLFQDDPTGTTVESTSGALHRAAGGFFFMGMILAALFLAIELRRVPGMRWLAVFSVVSGLVSLAFLLAYGATVTEMHPLTGLIQRLLAFSLLTWLVVVSAVILRRRTGQAAEGELRTG